MNKIFERFLRWFFVAVAAGLVSACGADIDELGSEPDNAGAEDSVSVALEVGGTEPTSKVDGTTGAEQEVMLAVALAFLEDRNQQLMDGKSPVSASAAQNMSEAMSARVTRDNVALHELRDKLAQLGERYTGFKTETKILTIREVYGKTVARIEETSRFEYAWIRGDEPPYVGFRVEREFTFSRRADGVWILEDVMLLDPTGVAPINEVVAPAPPKERLTFPPEGAADLSKSSLLPEVHESIKNASELNVGVAFYNSSAMANYAITWALSRNPAYRQFSNDCTNFISQAMIVGGWAQVEGWYQSNDAWWYNTLNQSYTWAGAHNWYLFATGSGRTNTLSNVWHMKLADVLQVDFDKDGNISHSMMVTQVAGSELYLSYHTTDTINRSLSSILAAYPSAWYYAHRT